VLDALARANDGHALAYGADHWTNRADTAFADLFDCPAEVLFVWGGTGANIVGLQALLTSYQAIICPAGSHIAVDECGAPERFIGCKLIDVATTDGKLRPDQVRAELHGIGDQHHVQPKVISITQSTELGTLYQLDEIAELAELAHANDMYLHLDGARIANATAALGIDLASFTSRVGVDVMTFGGTKNGMMYGEAVVFLDPQLARSARFIRKQAGQLPSKMRFVAAQFLALLTDGLWLQTAGHANAMATRLYEATRSLPGIGYDRGPEVNAVFPVLPPGVMERLSQWCFFWPWEPTRNQARWMTAWDTTADDVDQFARGVAAALDGSL
jgi:threonine aldolase